MYHFQVGHAAQHACCGACLPPASPLLVDFDEILNAPVITPLDIIGEKTGRHLPHFPVIQDTFAADALAGAGAVGTIAVGEILFLITLFHEKSSPQNLMYLPDNRCQSGQI